MNKVFDRLISQLSSTFIEEKAKRMQINSEVASEVEKAVQLIQLLSQDLGTNCNPNKKSESFFEKNCKLNSQTKKIRKVDTNQTSHKNSQIQSIEDERNLDLEDASKEIAISSQRLKPSKATEFRDSPSSKPQR